MIGVILAAGRGTRLGALGERRPKALLEVGEETLIERSLDALVDAGVRDVVVVLGHQGEAIIDLLGDRHRGLGVRYVWNKEYETTGSAVSLALVEDSVDGSLVVMESDLFFDPAMMTLAVEALDASVLLVVEPTGSGDEVFVHVDQDNALVDLGKGLRQIDGARCAGELAGITLLTSETFRRYASGVAAERMQGRHDFHYEEVLADLAKSGMAIEVRECRGHVWTEIDTPADLERARSELLPRLRGIR